jgi:hypothetical protein
MITTGSHLFWYYFFNLGEDNFECDLDDVPAGAYDRLPAVIGTLKDRASCLENILQLVEINDLNKNNIVERCEDAKLQYNFGGSTREYALKYSSQYTRGAVLNICYTDFDE